jgi:hypothetical protein
VVTGAAEAPLLAAGPGRQLEVGPLAGGLHPQPGERRLGAGAFAGDG